jgi:SAM-dependent methyltransferase
MTAFGNKEQGVLGVEKVEVTSASEVAMAACMLCGSSKKTLLYRTRDRHYGIPGEFELYRCEGCSLVALAPMLTEAELNDFYPRDYFAYQQFEPQESPAKARFKRIVGMELATRDPEFDSPGTMLDVGCGSGRFLEKMRQKGWDVHGVEPSRSAAQLGRRQWQLDIRHGTLPSASQGWPDGMFDYIRSNHSFEHIPNPLDALGEMRRLLKVDGKLFIGVPNIGSVNAWVFGRYWWYLGAPVHTFNYSAATLRKITAVAGFRPLSIKCNSDYGGVVGSMQIYLNRNNGRMSGEGALINNVLCRVAGQWVAKALDLLGGGDAIEIVCAKRGDIA